MSSKKADKPIEDKQPAEDSAPESQTAAKSVRAVVVTHLDAPPPSGKKTIHPRRPAPIVPTREERTAEQVEDTNAEKQSSE